jgi:hypothetical protein
MSFPHRSSKCRLAGPRSSPIDGASHPSPPVRLHQEAVGEGAVRGALLSKRPKPSVSAALVVHFNQCGFLGAKPLDDVE